MQVCCPFRWNHKVISPERDNRATGRHPGLPRAASQGPPGPGAALGSLPVHSTPRSCRLPTLGQLEDVLHAVNDAQRAGGRDLADVAGVEPAVLLQHLVSLVLQARRGCALVSENHRCAQKAGAVNLRAT